MFVPLAAWAAWAITVAATVGLYSVVETFCPVDQMVSGMCVAPWFRRAAQAVFWTGSALAAVLIPIACTVVAPAHRRRVALVTFVVGALVALAMAIAATAYLELATALVVGALVTWRLRRAGWVNRPLCAAPPEARPS